MSILSTLGLVGLAACRTAIAQIEIQNRTAVAVPGSALTVTVAAPGLQRTLTGGDIGIPLATPTTGTLTLTADLRVGASPVSSGAVSLPLGADRSIGVSISVDSVNPTRTCLGCAGSRSFPVAAAFQRVASDSMWIVWSTNSLSNSVVF